MTLAQVHAALAYAYENLEQIRQAVREEEAFIAAFKQQYSSNFRFVDEAV